ncbi:hypothetical protein [Polaribacter sp.]|uniref:hypothetical protein n=1 Tax=Polaribacter sp. TaxID=1920175 RepID=UPI003F6B4192
MKKQITFLMLTLFFAFSTLQAQENVLYINQDGVEVPPGSGASTPGDDPVIRMLDADANFTVSYVEIGQDFVVTKVGENNTGANSVGNPIDFTGFDLVIVSDSMASNNGVFQDGNPLHIDELTVPVIYSKTFAFRGGDAVDVARNGAQVTQTQNLSVTAVNTSSDMFSGIDFGGGSEIPLFRTTSNDKGEEGYKAIDVLNGLENSSAGTLLASVEQVTTGEEDKAAVINYIPSGTTLGTASEVSTQDIVIFGFSYGATVKQDGGNVTSEYLTIWRNAAYMLTGQTVPTTLYTNPVYDKYEVTTETTRYDFTDGSIIPNPVDGYVIQGSPEADAQPQTDRFLSADGVLQYRHAAGDNFHSSTYGLNMKAGARVFVKPAGTGIVKIPLSQYSSLGLEVKMPNNNNKAYIKVNGVATSAPSKTTYQETLNATAAAGSDLQEFITIEYFPNGGGQNLELMADATNGGSDIYLPYIDVEYPMLKRKPTKVLYVNQVGVGQGEGASAPGEDPVIEMLMADEMFEVTYAETPQDGSTLPDLSGFDMVIAQETISSGAAMFQPDGVLGINNVSIPIIYNKSWAFRNGKAVTDADAAVTGTQNLSVTVDAANQTHPLFSGIDFSASNDVRIFKSATANDDGSAGGNKAIDVLNGLNISNANAGTLATVPEVTDASQSILINHIPAGTQLGEAATDVLGVDAITFAFSYGAQIFGDGANISPEALTIWRNAAYILAGLDVPTTLVENPAFFLPKKILYVNQIGVGSGAGASAPGQDPVIKMLMADDKFAVTYLETPSDGSAVDLTGYDLVIAQETISSGAAMFQPGGVLGVKDVTVPIIYNKSWAFRNGKAVTDADAAVTGTQNLSITATNTSHPLFSGIDFSNGDDIRIFKSATANDDGSTGGNKAIDVLNDLEFSSTSAGSVATVPEITDADKAMLVNYMPAGTQLGEDAADVLQVNAIGLAFSYGAQILGDGANISPEALTIWRNAAYMLAYGPSEVPTTLVENPAFFLAKDVLYVTKAGFTPAADASASTDDPIIRMLTDDENFNVTVVETDGAGTGVDFTGYDLAIAQETFGSGDDIWKATGPFGIQNITIPVIYNKTWALRNGKGISSAAAAVVLSTEVSVTIDPANQTNSLFNGIDFSGSNDIRLYAGQSDNNGAVGTNAIDVLQDLEISTAGTNLATVSDLTTSPDTSIIINDIPSGTQIGTVATDVLQAPIVAFAFNYGAIIRNDGANISPEALTIWRNAAYKLTGIPVPTTLVENNDFTLSVDKVNEFSEVTSNVRSYGKTVFISNVSSKTEVKVYSITGALVKSMNIDQDTQFELKTGLYIATVKTFEGTKAVKFVTN